MQRNVFPYLRIDIYKIIQSDSTSSKIHTVNVCVTIDLDIDQNNQSKLYNLLFENVFSWRLDDIPFDCSLSKPRDLEDAPRTRITRWFDSLSSSFIRCSRTCREERSSYLSCERYRYTVPLSTTESFRSRNSSESFPLYSPLRAGWLSPRFVSKERIAESTVERLASLLSPCLASRTVASWPVRALNSLDLYEPCNDAARKRHRERKKTEQRGERPVDYEGWSAKGISAFVVCFQFWLYREK